MNDAPDTITIEDTQAVTVTTEAPPMGPDQPVAMVDPILAQAASIARLPGLNEGMFKQLMEWQQAERAAQAEERFNEAMNLCQREIEPVARTTENKATSSFFAKLEAVDNAIRPIYTKYGFSVRYNTVPPLTPGQIRVEVAISLGRHTERFYREAPPDVLGPKGTPTKTALHGGGSAETFLKRYCLCGAFNVVFRSVTDDDGVRGGMSFLSLEQADQLRGMCHAAGRPEDKFLRTMCSRLDGQPIENFDEVETKDFLRLSNTLALIIRQKKEKTDAENNT